MGVLCLDKKNRVEIQDFKDWKAGVYLIEAGCGRGKNYFVFNTLFPYAQQNGKRMLVFSNRVALREQQQAQTQEKDIKLITYQSLEHDEYLGTMQDTKDKVRGLMQQVSEYDYIVLDEAHYLYQDAPFNKNTETIIELIEKYRSSKIIVLLSATPDLLKKYLQIDKAYFFKADYSYIKEVQYYTKRDTLDEIISKIPEDEKIVVFADSKDRLKELHSEYPNSAYLDASNKKRRKVFNEIIESERFDCRILFTTRVSDNGINLTDKDIKHVIIETTDIVEFMQCLGRKRSQDENDTINLYFLDDIGRISGFYTKYKKDVEIAKEYELLKDAGQLEEFKKKYLKIRLPCFFDNEPKIIYPAYYKIQSDCEFYESIVSKGTSFHEEVENRLGRKAVWYERKKKNEKIRSYLLENIGRRYEKDEREELVRIIAYKKDGHFQRKIEKLNHYLTKNQIGFILKSIFENRKTYWIIESAKNERTSY